MGTDRDGLLLGTLAPDRADIAWKGRAGTDWDGRHFGWENLGFLHAGSNFLDFPGGFLLGQLTINEIHCSPATAAICRAILASAALAARQDLTFIGYHLQLLIGCVLIPAHALQTDTARLTHPLATSFLQPTPSTLLDTPTVPVMRHPIWLPHTFQIGLATHPAPVTALTDEGPTSPCNPPTRAASSDGQPQSNLAPPPGKPGSALPASA